MPRLRRRTRLGVHPARQRQKHLQVALHRRGDRHIRRQAKAERRTPEQAAELAAILAGLPRVRREEVEAGRSPAGGFTKKQLASWGVPWPPPAGWLHALMRGEDGSDDR